MFRSLFVFAGAGGGGGADGVWSLSGVNAFFNGGNVGIGASNPAERLTIANVAAYNTGLKLTGNSAGGVGLALESTADGGHKYSLLSGATGTSAQIARSARDSHERTNKGDSFTRPDWGSASPPTSAGPPSIMRRKVLRAVPRPGHVPKDDLC